MFGRLPDDLDADPHTKEMLGRIMALLMFSGTGLAPISEVLSKWSLTLLFAIPGALILLLKIWMAPHPDLKGFSESLSAAQAGE